MNKRHLSFSVLLLGCIACFGCKQSMPTQTPVNSPDTAKDFRVFPSGDIVFNTFIDSTAEQDFSITNLTSDTLRNKVRLIGGKSFSYDANNATIAILPHQTVFDRIYFGPNHSERDSGVLVFSTPIDSITKKVIGIAVGDTGGTLQYSINNLNIRESSTINSKTKVIDTILNFIDSWSSDANRLLKSTYYIINDSSFLFHYTNFDPNEINPCRPGPTQKTGSIQISFDRTNHLVKALLASYGFSFDCNYPGPMASNTHDDRNYLFNFSINNSSFVSLTDTSFEIFLSANQLANSFKLSETDSRNYSDYLGASSLSISNIGEPPFDKTILHITFKK